MRKIRTEMLKITDITDQHKYLIFSFNIAYEFTSSERALSYTKLFVISTTFYKGIPIMVNTTEIIKTHNYFSKRKSEKFIVTM